MSFVLLAHGSSDARHAREVRGLGEKVSGLLGEAVGCAFLSDGKLPQGARVLPLFLGHGRHGLVDAPRLAEESGATLLPSLAEHAERIAELAYDRVTASGGCVNALFGLYRFSGFAAIHAALLARSRRCLRVACGALHAEPSLATVLRLWREDGVGPVRLQPMLLFEGASMALMRHQLQGEDVEILPALSQGDDFTALVVALLRDSLR